MSRVVKQEAETGSDELNCIEELTARDMRSIHEEEASVGKNELTQEDTEEGWQKNPSPLAGRMTGSMEELERIQSAEMIADNEVKECIKDSLNCQSACVDTFKRCLELGGEHAEPRNVNLLLDCARICGATADFMLRNSTYYPQTCGLAADICDECADNCDRFEEDFMRECGGFCRRCAESCREMAR